MCLHCGLVHHTSLSRRALFGGGLAALALARAAWAAPRTTPEGVAGDDALRQLIAGNAR